MESLGSFYTEDQLRYSMTRYGFVWGRMKVGYGKKFVVPFFGNSIFDGFYLSLSS